MARAITETKGKTRIIAYENKPTGLMTGEGSTALLEAVRNAIEDSDIAVIVLTGADPAIFVRHYDVEAILAVAAALAANKIGPAALSASPFFQLCQACHRSPKPVIAAINGMCMGGGFELTLACDFRIAASTVKQIGLPETRIGVFPGGGGTQRLPRLIGEAKALEFVLRGRVVDAAAAKELGIVHAVAPDALTAALDLAAELARRTPGALAAAKALVRSALDWDIDSSATNEQAAFAKLLRDDPAAAELLKDFLNSGGDLNAFG